MSAPASSALFAGCYTRQELERVRDYIHDQLARVDLGPMKATRNAALQFELDVLETALACLPLPTRARIAND